MNQIIFFTNGNTSALGNSGLQVPKLQVPWFGLYLAHMGALGVDPTDWKFTINGGGGAIVVPFKTDKGAWAWEVKK